MHYRNGREAKNGDKIVQIENGVIKNVGVLHDAQPGNDYCNGQILPTSYPGPVAACLIDCLHADDVAEILKEKGLHERPAGK
jgi:hypothetical protein